MTPGHAPKTGEPCACRPGVERDNCPQCEGSGERIDFRAMHAANRTGTKCRVCGSKNTIKVDLTVDDSRIPGTSAVVGTVTDLCLECYTGIYGAPTPRTSDEGV